MTQDYMTVQLSVIGVDYFNMMKNSRPQFFSGLDFKYGSHRLMYMIYQRTYKVGCFVIEPKLNVTQFLSDCILLSLTSQEVY